MAETTEYRQRGARTGSYRHLGGLAGIIALLAGSAWCLKHHGPGSRSVATKPSGGRDHWLLKAVSAGLVGTAVGVASNRSSRIAGSGRAREVSLSSHATINQSADQLYDYWKDFGRLPQVMTFLERVEPLGKNTYHWVARGPVGPALTWNAEIVDDQPGRLFAWRSVEGSDIHNRGHVRFRPRADNRGTEVSVEFNIALPGPVTGAAARYLAGLETMALDQGLRDLKARLEAGEVPTARRFRATTENGGQV